jgi:hypothetical protein
MANNTLTLAEKLLTKTVEQGACLVWIGMKSDKGYGLLKLNGKTQRAHRLMYQLHFGSIPDGLVVRHSCDNPSCVNIAHLHLGTQLDNVKDMFERHRANKVKGERHPKSKLTDEQVAEIRRRYIPGVYGNGSHALAKEFGVSKTSIRAILSGKSRGA